MTNGEAEKIIQEYGKVLEVASAIGLAIPEQFLPYKKEEIIEAFKYAYNATDEENKNILATSFMYLPEFVPIDDAVIVLRYTNWLTSSDKSINPEDEKLKEDWQRIINKINNEMEEYMKILPKT